MKLKIPFPARRSRQNLLGFQRIAVLLPVALGSSGSGPASPGGMSHTVPPERIIAYRMDPQSWTMAPPTGWAAATAGSATFARDEGLPLGAMTLNQGIAVLKTGDFSTGQIDFDLKPLGYDDAGIIFHRRGEEDGEFVYVRANPDCPAAQDCVQYAPITHRLMAWNIYPNYQGPAPISATGWNHLTLQVADGKLRVYLNHAAEPSIVVACLRGLSSDGGLAFKGPAVYANLVVRPGTRLDMGDVVAKAVAPGTVTDWLAAPPTVRNRNRPVSASDMPAADAWHGIETEPTGLVNLGRAFSPAKAPSLSTAWLKTVVLASAAVRRVINVGFAMQASVFLNGQLVYTGNNPYYPVADRLSPGGRIEDDNAIIPLNLRRGRNEIVIAVGNDWRADEPTARPSQYGWAAEARFESTDGLDMRQAVEATCAPVTAK